MVIIRGYSLVGALALVSLAGCAGTAIGQAPAVQSTAEVTCPAPGSAAPLTFDTADAQQLRGLLTDMVDRGMAPGVSMIIEQSGVTVFDFTYGMADAEDARPLESDALFRHYSMSKPITSFAALQLVADGRLALNDHVSKFIPEFADATVYAQDGEPVPLTRAITVRDLITHQAGITYRTDMQSEIGDLYRSKGIPAGPGVDQPPTDGSDAITSNAMLATRIAQTPVLHQPGTRFTYGNGIDVLGRVIEIAADEPLSAVLQRQIFAPLDMRSTSFQVSSEDAGRLTSAYVGQAQFPDWPKDVLSAPPTAMLGQGTVTKIDDDETSFMLRDPGVEYGGAGLVGTAQDYLRFTVALRESVAGRSDALLPTEIAQDMSRNQLSAETIANSELLGDLGFGYGAAVKLAATDKAPTFPQCGLFWAGAASTYFWVDPAGETSGVMMTQVFGGDVRSYWMEAVAAMYGGDQAED